MSSRKRGLGRGLDALLGHALTEGPQTPDPAAPSDLPIDLVVRGRFQPRRHFDADKLRELADSIAAQGVVQPVVVRGIDGGRYELIAGERRWRAAQLAGLERIPAVVRQVDDQAAMAMGLIENIQRHDLNPLEEAQALKRLLGEFGLTHQEIAQAVGKSRTTVTNLVRLLDLNADVKQMIDDGKLEMGHARALLGLSGTAQTTAAEMVARKGLSVRETEALVRRMASGESAVARPSPSAAHEDPDVRRLLDKLTERIGAKVELKQLPGGRGRLSISYNSLEELEGILDHIR